MIQTIKLVETRLGVKRFSSMAVLFINGDSQNNDSQNNDSQSNDFDNSRSNPASWSADNVLPDDGYGIDFIEEVKLYCNTPEKAKEYFVQKRESVRNQFLEDTENATPGECQGHLHQKNLVMAQLNIQKRMVENHLLGLETDHLRSMLYSSHNIADLNAVADQNSTHHDTTGITKGHNVTTDGTTSSRDDGGFDGGGSDE